MRELLLLCLTLDEAAEASGKGEVARAPPVMEPVVESGAGTSANPHRGRDPDPDMDGIPWDPAADSSMVRVRGEAATEAVVMEVGLPELYGGGCVGMMDPERRKSGGAAPRGD